jgi:hypothetical protein
MTRAEFVHGQLGTLAGLISPADLEWLIREAALIEVVSRQLAAVEKGALDFAAMHPLLDQATRHGATRTLHPRGKRPPR